MVHFQGRLDLRTHEVRGYSFNSNFSDGSIKLAQSELRSISNDLEISFEEIDFRSGDHYDFIRRLDLSEKKVTFIGCVFGKGIELKCDDASITFYYIHPEIDNDHLGQISFTGSLNSLVYDQVDLKSRPKTLRWHKLDCDYLKVSFCSLNSISLSDCLVSKFSFESNGLTEFANFYVIGSKIYQFEMKACEFSDECFIGDSEIQELHFFNVKFRGDFNSTLNELKNVFFVDSKFREGRLSIANNYSEEAIDNIDVLNSDFENFRIHPLSSKNTMTMLRIDSFESRESSGFSLSNFMFGDVNISYEVKRSISFSNSLIKNLYLDSLSVHGKLNFDNSFKGADLGKLEMVNSTCENINMRPSILHNFKDINLIQSSLKGLNTTHLQDLNINVIQPTVRNPNLNYLHFFRELKIIALEINNNHLATKFRSLEYSELSNSEDENLRGWEKFILWANNTSNEHGTNPMKALWCLTVIVLIYVILLTLNCVSDGLDPFQWRNLKHFHVTLSPIGFLYKINYNFWGWLYVFDLLYKVVLAYIIYQFVSAFRKFNK